MSEIKIERVILFTLLICGMIGLVLLLLMQFTIIPDIPLVWSIAVVLCILGASGALMAPAIAKNSHISFEDYVEEREERRKQIENN